MKSMIPVRLANSVCGSCLWFQKYCLPSDVVAASLDMVDLVSVFSMSARRGSVQGLFGR